jgi:hypothetical protein
MTHTDTSPAPNAKRLLGAGFLAILATGIGSGVRGSILANWAADFGFTRAQLGDLGGPGLGYAKDRFTVEHLKATNAPLYEANKSDKAAGFMFLEKVQGLDALSFQMPKRPSTRLLTKRPYQERVSSETARL